MTNEIKQELKDNARFFPRSVCFEKAVKTIMNIEVQTKDNLKE